jgi:hypothetical protein
MRRGGEKWFSDPMLQTNNDGRDLFYFIHSLTPSPQCGSEKVYCS